MIIPNARFRPSPTRAVYVHGPIDPQMVQRLTPRVILLQSQSRNPITVYVDSPGGRIDSMGEILKLLRSSNQDYEAPCRIITVVTSRAASAAADLLSSGDYVIAYPESTILYHGSRTFRDREVPFPITVETTALIGLMLRLTNEKAATELLGKIEDRFMMRLLLSRGRFPEIRKNNPQMTDAECFLAMIAGSLSEPARRLFDTAKQLQGRYDALWTIIRKPYKGKTGASIEAKRIKALVDFEVSSNKKVKNWTFQGAGLTQLTEDFFLLNDQLSGNQSNRINHLCNQWGKLALDAADQAEIDKVPEPAKKEKITQRVRLLIEPVMGFFNALCHALQQGENNLTATDAYWLGLIDEVMGNRDLPSLRHIAEYQPDPPPPPAPAELGPAVGQEPEQK